MRTQSEQTDRGGEGATKTGRGGNQGKEWYRRKPQTIWEGEEQRGGGATDRRCLKATESGCDALDALWLGSVPVPQKPLVAGNKCDLRLLGTTTQLLPSPLPRHLTCAVAVTCAMSAVVPGGNPGYSRLVYICASRKELVVHSLLRATRASDRAVTEVGTSVRRHWEKGDYRAGASGQQAAGRMWISCRGQYIKFLVWLSM